MQDHPQGFTRGRVPVRNRPNHIGNSAGNTTKLVLVRCCVGSIQSHATIFSPKFRGHSSQSTRLCVRPWRSTQTLPVQTHLLMHSPKIPCWLRLHFRRERCRDLSIPPRNLDQQSTLTDQQHRISRTFRHGAMNLQSGTQEVWPVWKQRMMMSPSNDAPGFLPPAPNGAHVEGK